ncbi:alpha/beta hydrolase [Nitrospirillum sp. BR 11828]|uniref:alpha/beta fold hydrolase n=1 Tax=Nitrospirillum sp. BR 11828 TaxID=3104325 RepID=UPI002ACAF58C|nr:alpha/beta hydrolase [Nitrospirillum sp. BR 11828]MDZ5645870.1 alpha/beta hydrolase [Nitrospirillum sp. BR 11828]
MGFSRGAAWVLATLIILVAALPGSMRLGWWNPSYDTVRAHQATPPSRFEQVGDVRVHLRDEGQGPVILMLHSSMTNLRLWDDWADQLKGSYRVIRFDWPPYGLTIDPTPSQGMPSAVALVERFVDQFKLDRFVIVASSSGATVATLYTARHPEKVRALALSTLPLKAPPPTPVSWFVSAVQWLHLNVVPNYNPEIFYRESLAQLYGRPERLKPETVRWYYETNNVPGGFARVMRYLEANQRTFWKTGAGDEAAAIRVPILLQWGDRDIVLPIDRADEARRMFANAPMQIIHYPDIGHYPMLELPGPTGLDLKAFLDTLPADAPPAGPETAR